MEVSNNQNNSDLSFLEQEGKSKIHIKDILFLIIHNLHWLILFATIGAVIGNFYARRQVRLYESNARIIIKNNDANTSNPLRDVPSGLLRMRSAYYDLSNLNNELMIMTSKSTMLKVVRNLNLNVTYSAKTRMVKRPKDLYGESPIVVDFVDFGDDGYVSMDVIPKDTSHVVIELEGIDPIRLRLGDTATLPVESP